MENQHFIPVVPEKEPFNFVDFLQFKRMITLQVIPVLYVIVAIIITFAGLGMMFAGRSSYSSYGGGGGFPFFQGGFLSGLIFILLGNIFWRMWCEFILVLFRVNKSLQNIDKNTSRNQL